MKEKKDASCPFLKQQLLYTIEHICRTFGQNYGILTLVAIVLYGLYTDIYVIWHIIWSISARPVKINMQEPWKQ